MPYFIKHFQISDDDNDICARDDKAAFERAAVKALGKEVFEKRNFRARFTHILQTAKDVQDDPDM